jgi:hypothetical protein
MEAFCQRKILLGTGFVACFAQGLENFSGVGHLGSCWLSCFPAPPIGGFFSGFTSRSMTDPTKKPAEWEQIRRGDQRVAYASLNLAQEFAGAGGVPFRYRLSSCRSTPEGMRCAMLGILVHGDNHFIARGPLPDRETAIALVRHWSLIQIGASTPYPLDRWLIVSRAFRENLEWAVVVPGDGEISPAVARLLDELSARGIVIHMVKPTR